MKTKKTELEVDFIGGQGSLTLEEEKAISDFLKQRKLTSKTSLAHQQVKTSKRHNKTV